MPTAPAPEPRTDRAQRHPLTLDPKNMLGAVRDLPTQVERGWERARRLVLPTTHGRPRGIVLAGMGGSAIAGDLTAALVAPAMPVPIAVVRDYRLPGWVGEGSLVVCSSFSGETEETLAAWEDAGRRGAQRVAICSGGRLMAEARSFGAPVVPLPGGGQPRAAFGHSLTSVLGVLHATGLVDDPSDFLRKAVTMMRVLVATSGEGEDPALSPSALAARLEGRIPVLLVSESMAPVARRWKAQLNENAKTFAAMETVPEAGHNAIEGFGFPRDAIARCHVLALKGDSLPARHAAPLEATARLLEEAGVPHTEIRAPGGGRLAESLWLVQFGDLLSVFLAYRNGIDPTAIPRIGQLKAALAP